MPLTPGTRVGVYEITAQIGAGGMGEVYRATDTKLKRQVAIKVLPDSLAADRDRLARFQREAEVLASLNHPNIAAIYGLEESNPSTSSGQAGITALVMELVEGDDLSQRIVRLSAPGASAGEAGMPLDEALPIARQIAEALEAAHEQGIVHRDLKPANIKVRPDGTVKVLDFGLAKALDVNPASATADNLPTITSPAQMTGVGVILGTAAYMSPEQARGKVVDKRADIWAFGAVLFEMLTGTRAFPGEGLTDTLAAVVRAEPNWTLLPAGLPSALSVYLRRCLNKDPKQRAQAIGDVRLALEGAFDIEPAVHRPTLPVAPRSAWSRALPWISASSALVFAIAWLVGWAPWRSSQAVEHPLVRLDVELGTDVLLGSSVGVDVIISPDGNRLVFASQGRLFTRLLDQPTAVELEGTQGAFAPFFSPDGRWVGFFVSGQLKKISVEGGATVTLCRVQGSASRGGSWGADGTIAASLDGITLSQLPDTGGIPSSLTTLAEGETRHRWPQFLPGGKALLLSVRPSSGTFDEGRIDVLSIRDGSRKTVQRGGMFGRYVAASNGSERVSGVRQQGHRVRRALRPRPAGSARHAIACAGGSGIRRCGGVRSA